MISLCRVSESSNVSRLVLLIAMFDHCFSSQTESNSRRPPPLRGSQKIRWAQTTAESLVSGRLGLNFDWGVVSTRGGVPYGLLPLYYSRHGPSKYVETETNVTDQLTPLLSINRKDGVGVLKRRQAPTQGQETRGSSPRRRRAAAREEITPTVQAPAHETLERYGQCNRVPA